MGFASRVYAGAGDSERRMWMIQRSISMPKSHKTGINNIPKPFLTIPILTLSPFISSSSGGACVPKATSRVICSFAPPIFLLLRHQVFPLWVQLVYGHPRLLLFSLLFSSLLSPLVFSCQLDSEWHVLSYPSLYSSIFGLPQFGQGRNEMNTGKWLLPSQFF